MSKPLPSVLALLLTGLLVIACTPIAAPGQDVVPSSAGTLPEFSVDMATLLAVDYRRSGGGAADERVQLFRDGHAVLERSGQPPITFWLSSDELAQIDAAFEAVDFHRRAQQAQAGADATSPAPADNARRLELTRRGLLVQSTLTVDEDAVPDWAQSLFVMLDPLLFAPTADRLQAAPATPAAGGSQRVILLELRRHGGVVGVDEQLLLNLDGGYSVSRQGTVVAGQLTPEQMAALLQQLESLNLAERQGDYLPADLCCDRIAYELIYRNLMGSYQVRTMDGAVPDWLQPVLDSLQTTLIQPSVVASAATPSPAAAPAEAAVTPSPAAATAKATATPTAPVTETPVAPPAASPTALPTTAPTAVALPTAAAAGTATFALADLYGALVAQGAALEPTGARILKPYLSVPGTIVRVNGLPVQLFEYPDEAALTADVDGLAADASSIDGTPLTWPASPHFWRRGQVLALAVTDDSALIAALSAILGAPVAGQ